MTGWRGVLFTADDYGQSPGISRGIADLAAAGRLAGVSCLANGPGWRADAPALKDLRGRVDIGLHLCLTEFAPLGPMPRLAPAGKLPGIGALTLQALAGALAPGEIRDELARQFDAFTDALGFAPDFLDGHQHAHSLPRVRGLVIDLFRSRLDPEQAYIRSCLEPPMSVMRPGIAVPKAMTLSVLNTGFPATLARAGIRSNQGYKGVHGFAPETPDAVERRFAGWFAHTGHGGLINCHPGHADPAPDPIAATRPVEFAFLAGERFPQLLDRLGVHLARFREIQSAP